MEVLFSVENFEESNGKYHEVNSPRTLEACLRNGLDPAELYPRLKAKFASTELTPEMVDAKYETFERKRKDKIANVRLERNNIIVYNEKKRLRAMSAYANASSSPDKTLKELQEEAGNAALEMVSYNISNVCTGVIVVS